MTALLRWFQWRTIAPTNMTTQRERERFLRTMPGEMGARAGERYGFLIC